MPDWLLFLILTFLLIIFAAYFALAETAFSCLNRFQFEVKANNGSRNAKLVVWIADRFDSALVTALLGTNIISVALSTITTFLFLQTLPNLDNALVSLIASLSLTIVLYIFGETIPKQIAKKIPNKCASLTSYPLVLLIIVFYPVTILFRLFSFLAGKIFHTKAEPSITEEEFNLILDSNEKKGLIEVNESELIQNSFDFSDTKVQEVLTKREKMFTIDLRNMTKEKLLDVVCSTSYSRIPVYYGDPNKIIGILIVKNFLADYLDDKNANLNDSLEKPYIVSPSISMDSLIERFRERNTEIALVYTRGQLIGMVTMEDVLEELVGSLDEREEIEEPKKKRGMIR